MLLTPMFKMMKCKILISKFILLKLNGLSEIIAIITNNDEKFNIKTHFQQYNLFLFLKNKLCHYFEFYTHLKLIFLPPNVVDNEILKYCHKFRD